MNHDAKLLVVTRVEQYFHTIQGESDSCVDNNVACDGDCAVLPGRIRIDIAGPGECDIA